MESGLRRLGAVGGAAALTLAAVLTLATVVTRFATAVAFARVLALASMLLGFFGVVLLVLTQCCVRGFGSACHS
jgi:hypothetical protein